jgi:hypothetical protein
MALSVLAMPNCCGGLHGGYWDMRPWKGETAVISFQVCVALRPKNDPDGDDGRDVGLDEK